MRILSAVHFFGEVGSKTWKATPITTAMATEEIAAGHKMMLVEICQQKPSFGLYFRFSHFDFSIVPS